MRNSISIRLTYLPFFCLIGLFTFLLFGCSSNRATNGVDESYVLVKELEFTDQSLTQSELTGQYLYRAKIKNNSDKTIKGITIDIKLNPGDYTTLATYDTLLPGESSAYVECYGPTSGKIEDMSATQITIRMYDEANKEIIVKYNVNQNQYQYEEGKTLTDEKPVVLAKELVLIDPQIVEEKETESHSFQGYIKNNSTYNLTNVVYTFELDNGNNVYFMTQEELEPGATSSLIKVVGPESANLSDLKIKHIQYAIINKDGKITLTNYDPKLDKYWHE